MIKELKKAGWKIVSQRGSHIKMKKKGKLTIIPIHGGRDLPRGTLKAIEKQTGENIL